MTGKAYYITTLGDWHRHAARFTTSHWLALDGSPQSDAATRILVLVEGDEGAHLALDDDPAFEPLPHPLAQKAISNTAQAVLAPHGVVADATTFEAAEALSRVHPLLRHRVF